MSSLGMRACFTWGMRPFTLIGAYFTAILNTQYGVPVLWLMLPAGSC